MSDTTVGDLRRALQAWSDDDLLEFAGGLTFNRARSVGDDTVFIEFCEIEAELTPQTQKTIKVAFGHAPNFADDQSVIMTTVPRI